MNWISMNVTENGKYYQDSWKNLDKLEKSIFWQISKENEKKNKSVESRESARRIEKSLKCKELLPRKMNST